VKQVEANFKKALDVCGIYLSFTIYQLIFVGFMIEKNKELFAFGEMM
jgi:hypothetical protein